MGTIDEHMAEAVRVYGQPHHALEVVNTTLKSAVAALVAGSSLASASAALRLPKARIDRYLNGTPPKGDIVSIQLMIVCYQLATVPILTSISYSLGDPLGGGQQIVLAGTNLDSATVSFGGTSATVISASAAQVRCTLPAKTAGATTVKVNTAVGGDSNTLPFEFWSPATEASNTQLLDGGYTGAPWVARHGSNDTSSGADPAASGGGTVWAGGQLLTTPAINTLMPVNSGLGTAQGTCFMVWKSTGSQAAHTPGSNANPGLYMLPSSPSFNPMFDAAGFTMRMFDVSAGHSQEVNLAWPGDANYHLGMIRFADSGVFGGSGDLRIQIDGGLPTTSSMQNFNNGQTGTFRMGVDSSIAHFLNNVTMIATGFHNVRISDAVASKHYQWARQHLGVA